MLRLLVLITIISGVSTRGVPGADDNVEFGPKEIKTDRKNHSSEYATLTDCKDCQETKKNNDKNDILVDLSSDDDDDDVESIENTQDIVIRAPKSTRSQRVKPFLTFHRINVNVNRYRNSNRKTYRRNNNGFQRHSSRRKEHSDINANNDNYNRRTNVKTPQDKSSNQTKLSQNVKPKGNKDITRNNGREKSVENDKIRISAGRDRENKVESDKNELANNKQKSEESQQNNKANAEKGDDEKKHSDETSIAKSNNGKNKKPTYDLYENQLISKQKGLLESKVVIDKGQALIAEELENIKLTSKDNLKINDNSNEKTTRDIQNKIFKDTNEENEQIKPKISAGNKKHKNSRLSEPRLKNKPTETIDEKTETVDNKGKFSLHISTEKPNDQRNVLDHKLPRTLKDRWSRKGLSQVPDVERLERRLHPTVDAPVNDIIRSMKNMLRLIQSGLSKVDKDFVMIQNTTRWKYMLGVRNQLSELARENDEVYDIVMETSLLTKQIYRQAHERKHPRSDIEAVAVAYRSRLNTNMDPQIRENFDAAQTELKLAERLIDQLNNIQKQKDLLFQEEMRIHELVRERLPMRNMHDLYRRADQTIRVLTAAQPLSRYGEKNKLYMHMKDDSDLNMRRARELIVEGFDMLMHAKRVLLENRRKAQDHTRLMRNRLPANTVSDMAFDSARMEQFVASDTATHHANSLAETAAEIHMKFVPLMRNAKEAIANNSGYEFKKRLEMSLSEMKETVMKLEMTLDHIRLVIGVEEIIKDRCEAIFSSAGRFGFDRDSPLDCDPYLIFESSGDEIDGSGDEDDTFVDMETNTTKLHKENITNLNASFDESFIDIDEPLPTNTIVDIDITKSNESSIDIDTKHSSVDNTKITINDIEKSSPIDIDITKDKHNISANGKTQQTTETPQSPKVTRKSLTKEADIKTTPVNNVIDIDDEDIAQELKHKMTKKTQLTTTTTPPSTTNTTEGSDEDLFFDVFGWWNDAPDSDSVVIDPEYDSNGITSAQINMTLNEHIRERLYNFSQDSKKLLDEAKEDKSKIDEISLTWQKVKNRFGHLENKTENARALIIEWKANRAYFRSVHSRVKDVKKDMRLKKEVIEKQCKEAVDAANKKYKNMKKLHEKKKEKVENAADPAIVSETIDQVKVVLDNVNEINRLKQLYPSPCNTLESLDRKIRTNITDLRQKIERAKLIASTLQVAVAVPKEKYLEFPITRLSSEDHPLTSQIQMMLKHSGSDGRLMSLHVGEDESLSLDVESDALKVVQTLDGDENSQTLYEEEISDKWYLIQLQRFAASYNFTMFGENGLLRQVGFPSSSDSQRAFTRDLLPTTVRVGATGDDLNACALGFEINGRGINMFDMADNKSLLSPCSSQVRWQEQQLILDGSGYAVIRFSDIGIIRLLTSIKISFNPRSDGTIIYLQPKQMSTLVDVYVEKGFLVVFVHYRGFETKLKTSLQVYSHNNVLEIKFTSGRTKQANVILNGVSNVFKTAKGGKRHHLEDTTNVLLGGHREGNSSMVGCIKSLEINNEIIPFHYIYEAEGHSYGSCPQTECVIFDANSVPIEITNLSSAHMIHLSISRGSLGPVLQYSKHKEKFNLKISLNTKGIHVEETVHENSEDFSISGDSEFIIITIQDDLKSKSVKVTINDENEDFSYKKGGGAWWTGGDKDKDGGDSPTSYSVSIATVSDDSPEFLGKIQNLIIDGRPIELLTYVDSNKLGRCTVNPLTIEKKVQEPTTKGITCH